MKCNLQLVKANEGCFKNFPPELALQMLPMHYSAAMQVTESIQCPFCGQSFELVIDTSVESQQFTTDCEICCRPFEVFAECEPGEILSLDLRGN